MCVLYVCFWPQCREFRSTCPETSWFNLGFLFFKNRFALMPRFLHQREQSLISRQRKRAGDVLCLCSKTVQKQLVQRNRLEKRKSLSVSVHHFSYFLHSALLQWLYYSRGYLTPHPIPCLFFYGRDTVIRLSPHCPHSASGSPKEE